MWSKKKIDLPFKGIMIQLKKNNLSSFKTAKRILKV